MPHQEEKAFFDPSEVCVIVSRRLAAAVAVLALLPVSALIAGCGDAAEPPESSAPQSTEPPEPSVPQSTEPPVDGGAPKGAVPASLASAESAAEDLIDEALAGRRDQVVANADELAMVASGPLAAALRKAGVAPAEISSFQRRALEVKRLAPRAPLIDVALASNHAFELMPDFFARFDVDAPPDVTRLDYLDFEAKLQSKAGDAAKLGSAVRRLGGVWTRLRPEVVRAGGRKAAADYDAHVKAMIGLSGNAHAAATQQEAQHGLDLVDAIEHVFAP